MPPTLSYGLNLPNKKPQGPPKRPPGLAGQKRKKTIFDSDSEGEGEAEGGPSKDASGSGAVEITTIGGLDSTSPSQDDQEPDKKRPAQKSAPSTSIFDKPTLKKPVAAQDNKAYMNLAALHSSNKHAQTAADIDPTVYDYDAIYDSIHTTKESKTSSSDSVAPKYITNLLRSAEVRKRDQLRARDRLLAKEREAEGDEFKDKEQFVTAAYKAQQEEVRRIEEEEAAREKEEEERRRKGGGMMGFYKQMLDRDEQIHGEAVKAAAEAAKRKLAGEDSTEDAPTTADEGDETGKSEAQIAAELNARGAKVVVNDEGQIVDKRQLLSAGLNVAAKPKSQTPAPAAASSALARDAASRRTGDSEAQISRQAQRARQTQMVAQQLEEQTRRQVEEEEAQRKALAEKNKSTKSKADVSGARERFLERKRQKELEAAKEKG